jgi:hypothetical protein
VVIKVEDRVAEDEGNNILLEKVNLKNGEKELVVSDIGDPNN